MLIFCLKLGGDGQEALFVVLDSLEVNSCWVCEGKNLSGLL